MKLRSCFWLAPLLGACGAAPDADGAAGIPSGSTLPTPAASSEPTTTPSTGATFLPPASPPDSSTLPSTGPTSQVSSGALGPTDPLPAEQDTSEPPTDSADLASSTASGGETVESLDAESSAAGASSQDVSSGETSATPTACAVRPVTEEFRASYDLDPFYTRYADAAGLPVVGSDAPSDQALLRVCELVLDMTMRADVREALIDRQVRFAVIGQDELTNDIPEFSHLDDSINQRARGLGSLPAASCAEESILCDRSRDRWRGEGICVHEFAHTISLGGVFAAIPDFQRRLEEAFAHAQSTGLFQNTYRMENAQEYWAEGVQDWYFTNLEADPANGVHNFVDRREELEQYDPMLHELIAEFLPEPVNFVDCYSDE
jgi:hypothetical protein